MKRLICCVCAGLLLSGCADTKKTAPKDGRIAVKSVAVYSVEKTQTKIIPNTPQSQFNWGQNNGNAQNLMPHGKIGQDVSSSWIRSVGKGISDDFLILPEPIIFNNIIYALDSRFQLSAVNENNGELLWKKELPIHKDMGIASIGLATDGEKIYAVSGTGLILAMDMQGTPVWQKDTRSILRSAPTVFDNLLYVLSGNNELFAVNTSTGEIVWQYRNISTATNLMGMGQPAVSNDVLVVPFSSGEIIAFNAKTGTILWSDLLLSSRTFNQIQDLSHVLASPVIEQNTVYLVGNAGKTGAFNLQTGTPQFIQNIGGQNTPMISGNALFMITNRHTLVALDKQDGKLIWETDLESTEPKKIVWNGPVMVNNALITTSNKGDILLIDALTGTIKQKMKDKKLSNQPIIGNNKIILYTNDADLIAYE
ncbi:MAG: PQQ-binding-like beta-propeller repeat protein [Alphaproteobacteria bacterium]|nr:PQQ-binding-like beta-propeller repeat protein [Alphaproteobacteria bacterium]MBR3912771.1 PQQ-binding-like beta-propeller repeat protein [Alphaproteobacteria bacterium]